MPEDLSSKKCVGEKAISRLWDWWFQALCAAYARQLDFRQFFRALACVVLLGTPHSAIEEEKWQNFGRIVQGNANTWRTKKHVIDPKDIRLLAASSLHFDQARASVPILSGYEAKKSQIKSFLQSKKLRVSGTYSVDPESSRVRIP